MEQVYKGNYIVEESRKDVKGEDQVFSRKNVGVIERVSYYNCLRIEIVV